MASLTNVIRNAFSVEEGEGKPVILLFLLSAFLGIFYVTFDICATTLFLDQVGESMLSKAFLVSGVIGLLMTTIYSKLQNHISFSKLAIITFVAITVLTGLMRSGFEFTNSYWLIFFVFIMMGPLNILAIIAYWGLAGRLFSLRQGKRLFGLVYSGQLLGIIIISFAIPVVISIVGNVENLLLVSAGSSLLALIVQFLISGSYSDKISGKSESKQVEKEKRTKLLHLFKNKYVLMMSVFVVLSMISAFFIYYSFLIVTGVKYTDEVDLASFLGVFIASANIFSFIIRTFLYSKILKNYGLKVALVAIPFLLGVFTAGAVLVGTFLGYDSASESFIFFFVIISLSRLFSITLKDSVQIPTFEIMYQSVSKKIRFQVQAAIDGIVNEFAAIFSGLLLLVLSLLTFIEIIHYSWLLFFIIVVWVYTAIRLYSEYKSSLQLSIEESGKKEQEDVVVFSLLKEIDSKLSEEDSSKVISAMKMVEIAFPERYETYLVNLLEHINPEVRRYALNKIRKEKLLASNSKLKEIQKKEDQEDLKLIIGQIIKDFEAKLKDSFLSDQIAKLVVSTDPEERRIAAKIAGVIDNNDNTQYLIVLLRDIIAKVRLDAINTSSKIKKPELVFMLIENLLTSKYSIKAANALREIGEDALDMLEQTFYKSGIEISFQIRIIEVIGDIGGEKAKQYLVGKINHHSRTIVIAALQALNRHNYSPDENTSRVLQQMTEANIRIAGWNLSVVASLKEIDGYNNLKEAFDVELKDSYDVVYLLLSLIYDKQTVMHIRDTIDSDDGEGATYAVELLDMIVSEELKPILFPLFEEMPYIEKVKKLQDHFPLEKYDIESLIEAVINRDSNCINRWTKACALFCLSKIESVQIKDYLVAQMFNQDSLLRELAGWIIYRNNKEAYDIYSARIGTEHKAFLDRAMMQMDKDDFALKINRIFYFMNKEEFLGLRKEKITDIAEKFELISATKDEELMSSDKNESLAMYILLKGQATLVSENKVCQEFEQDDLIDDLIFTNDNEYCIKVTEASTLFKLNNDNRSQVIHSNNELASVLLHFDEKSKN